MGIHDNIDNLLHASISIIEKEVLGIQARQLDTENNLGKSDADKLIEYVKTLVIVRKDWRLAEKEVSTDTSSLSPDDLENAILAEADKILVKRKLNDQKP